MSNIIQAIQTLETEILILETENNKVNSQITNLTTDNNILFETINKSLESVEFIENVANQERKTIRSKIEKMITDALRLVYNDTYSIEFDYSVKRNKTSVKILLVKQTSQGIVKREMGGFGGGVADTIALPLKLLVLLASNTSDKILVVDEPGKHLDGARVDKFFMFLNQLIDKLGIQLIICSHHSSIKDYATNINFVDINKKDNCSIIT